MANTKLIKTKIKSVNNLQKIVKALEIVSTIKLQKLKQKTINFRAFMQQFLGVLQAIKEQVDIFDEHKLVHHKEEGFGKRLIIVVTTDKGLCGSLNSKITKHIQEKYGGIEEAKKNVDIFVIGKKGLDFFVGGGRNIVGTCHIKDSFDGNDLNTVFVYIRQALKEHRYAKIKIYFNYFKNVVTQIPLRFKLYPLDKESFDAFLSNIDTKLDDIAAITNHTLVLEPDAKRFAQELIQEIIHHIVYYAVLNNKTSEQASRMLAMKNAKDNCGEIVGGLQTVYNKTRQGKITQEISEIVSAKIAIES